MFSPIVLLVFFLALTNATEFTIFNNCSQNITVSSITSYGSSFIEGDVVLLPQESISTSTTSSHNRWIGNFYVSGSAASLAEFALNQWNGMDFYDISLILGFNLGIQISPSNGCQEVACTSTPCSQAFMKPSDNFATHECRTGANYIITFCPSV